MADEIKLTLELEKLLKELKKLEKKKEAAVAIGGVALGNAIGLQIDMAKEFIGAALVAEAGQEAADAAALAQKVADGQVIVAPGDDQKQITEAEEEIQRIKDKLKKADDLLDGNIPPHLRDDVDRINDDIPEMVEELGKAAIAAAAREVAALKEAIEAIKKGNQPNKGSKKGPGPPPGKPKGGGTGSGSSGSSSSSSGGDVDSIGDGGTQKEPDPTTIWVRSENSVWAWARRTQSWIEQAFQTPILEVQEISGGLLVIAKEDAALFDTAIGTWLGVLGTTPQELLEGGSS